MTLDDVLSQIKLQMRLEAETEQEVLEEIRSHLEDAVAAAQARGLDEEEALNQAAAEFGVEQTAAALYKTHAGQGALEGVAVAALPVLFTLVLRWMIFAPNGTTDAWPEMLSRTTLVVIAGVAFLLPLLRFPRRRYAIVLWAFFWALSLATVLWPTERW